MENYTTNNSLLSDSSALELYSAACFFSLICILGILGNVLYAYIVLKQRKSFSNSFYTMALSLTIPDNITLIAQLIYSNSAILNGEHFLSTWYRLIIGYAADWSWFVLASHMFCIAMNRLVAVVWHRVYGRLFTTRFAMVLIAGCYLYGTLMTTIMYACTCTYAFPDYAWTFLCTDEGKSCSLFSLNLNMYLSNGKVASVLLCYVGILFKVRQIGASANNQEKREYALMIQFAAVVVVLATYVSSFWLVPALVQSNSVSPKSGNFIVNTFCLLNSSLSPYLYFAFSSELRAKLLRSKTVNAVSAGPVSRGAQSSRFVQVKNVADAVGPVQ